MHRSGPRNRWLIGGLILAAVFAASWLAGFLLFTSTLPVPPGEHPPASDGIVVLTGEGERLTAAVGLLRSGSGQRLLVSGVGEGIGETSLRRVLGLSVELGEDEEDIFTCCIDMGREAQDTEGNAAEAAIWAERHGYASLCVVTASYHMPRALLEIRRRAPGLELLPYPVFPEQVVVERWWANPGTARTLVAEYNKYLVVAARAYLFR